MEQLEQQQQSSGILSNWLLFPKLIDTPLDMIANTLTSLTSPVLSLYTDDPKPPKPPHPDDYFLSPKYLVKRVTYGVLGAVYAGMVLSLVMVVAAILSVMIVNSFVEEPLFVKEMLHFDYTDVNPEAVFVFRERMGSRKAKDHVGVPVGHTFHVSVQLLVPDSEYNHDIGVFQLMAEVLSSNGKIIARSSQPTMLQFQSHPIRLMRTIFMGLPLLLGFSRETQKIKVQMLNYKEDNLIRTEAIKITLMPRAGTVYLPQLYEAEILMHSRLPRMKAFVHNWKWTFYVWVTLHMYIMLLAILLCFFRSLLLFPVLKVVGDDRGGRNAILERGRKPVVTMPEEKEFAETLRKWQQFRRKRKAEILSKSFMEDVGSISASSYTVTKEEIATAGEEDVADAESICLSS